MFSPEQWAYKKMTVPYPFLQHSVRSGNFTSAKVLVAAKMIFGASFEADQFRVLARTLRLTDKTIRKHLDDLVAQNWISYDKKSNRYINRNWNYFRNVLSSSGRTGYHIWNTQLRDYKAIAIAATYDQLISLQQYREWQKRRDESKKGTHKQTDSKAKGYYPVSNEAYSKIYGVSLATASRYRKLASSAGYIDVKQDHVKIALDAQVHRNINAVRRYSDRPVVCLYDSYYIQKPSIVRSRIYRKKLKALGKGKPPA